MNWLHWDIALLIIQVILLTIIWYWTEIKIEIKGTKTYKKKDSWWFQ